MITTTSEITPLREPVSTNENMASSTVTHPASRRIGA